MLVVGTSLTSGVNYPVYISLQAKRKRGRTPTPGKYLGLRERERRGMNVNMYVICETL